MQQANLHASGPKPRVLYANAEFSPENCYGAADPFVWSFWEALTDSSATGKRRRRECRRLRLWDQAYAEAIVRALECILPVQR